MNLKSSVAVAASVLGLTASAEAMAASPTCREVRTGAVERVCRWPVGKGEFVNVYYGQPSPAAPPEPAPFRNQISYAPPVYEAAPAYYGYGYVLPSRVGAGAVRMRDGRQRTQLGSVGRPPTFLGGLQGSRSSGGLHGRAGWRR